MIVSASRRTDIPRYYAPWLINRLRAGYALAADPYDARHLTRVGLRPSDVDLLVLWTKDPRPLLARLGELDDFGIPYYFQYTITTLGPDLEPAAPDMATAVGAFLRLSRRLGPERVDWRFDPVLIDEAHPLSQTVQRFCALADALRGATARCILSFCDPYGGRKARPMGEETIRTAARALGEAAAARGLPLFACAEPYDLRPFGILPGACIDAQKAARILASEVAAKKDAGQRPACRCLPSVDIGAYDTCPAGCAYCYATHSARRARERCAAHDPNSPLLTGWPRGDERVTERAMPSIQIAQTRLPIGD